MTHFIRTPVLTIKQPLGVFYAAAIPASKLLQVTYSSPLTIEEPSKKSPLYPLTGTQRPEKETRLKEIGRFINTTEAAFPNSIIVAANYTRDGTELKSDERERWRVIRNSGGLSELVVPTEEALATIVDGQHRLHGFDYAEESRKEMPLLCSVYLDLPNAFQAYLFATINFNQKKVDRSLAYELFGFNVEDEPPATWSPDKAAVFLCRKLNTDPGSPLRQRIIVAAENEESLFSGKPSDPEWRVSTATIVDGILSLISSNPKRDRDQMHAFAIGSGRHRDVLPEDTAPLRLLYKNGNDLAIFTAVKNYFGVVESHLWKDPPESSYITRTVGVQALFDVLKALLVDFAVAKDISAKRFAASIQAVRGIDFTDDFFQASGKGRVRLKNAMLLKLRLVREQDLSTTDVADYKRLTR